MDGYSHDKSPFVQESLHFYPQSGKENILAGNHISGWTIGKKLHPISFS
jgi:hypothetical protein